jgi:hypothetical protein
VDPFYRETGDLDRQGANPDNMVLLTTTQALTPNSSSKGFIHILLPLGEGSQDESLTGKSSALSVTEFASQPFAPVGGRAPGAASNHSKRLREKVFRFQQPGRKKNA